MVAALRVVLAAAWLLSGVVASSAQDIRARPVRSWSAFPPADRPMPSPASSRRSLPTISASNSSSRTWAAPAATLRPAMSRAYAGRLHHHGDQHRLYGEPQPLRKGAV